jgi:MerR family transcriptional regulator, light-induced transcriptional regulator
MPTFNEPIYNLSVVLKETGLKADTVRAWEKRYGLPNPARSQGGHRLYSEYDIAVIKWLIKEKKKGLSISKAAKLFQTREIQLEINNSMRAIKPLTETIDIDISEDQINILRDDWINACLDFDNIKADNALSKPFALFNPNYVITNILQKGLREIGELWLSNKISVHQEHFASNLAIRKMNSLIVASPLPTRNNRIIIACPSEEQHTFSALQATFILRNSGWDTIYLGADVPFQEINPLIKSKRISIVILIAMRLNTAVNLLNIANNLVNSSVKVAFGGLIFNRIPELREQIPGYYLGAELEDIPQKINDIHVNRYSPNVPEDLSSRKLDEINIFENIKEELNQLIINSFSNSEEINLATNEINSYFFSHITNALTLGDIKFLDNEIEWVNQLLVHRQSEKIKLTDYLSFANNGLKRIDSKKYKFITNWLDTTISMY